jgi:hypothetical protein
VLIAAPGSQASGPAMTAATTPATPATTPAAAPAVVSAVGPTAAPSATSTPAARAPVVSRSADRRAHRLQLRRLAQARKARQARRAARRHLPFAPSNAARTVAAAVRSTVNSPGRCLEWSREQAGIPSRYSDAATAWEHATGRRPRDLDPPRGAAVYWTGGSRGYGHIAISLGNHQVRSTDAAGAGQVATVSIHDITEEWHLEYAGWSNSINGYTIPGVAAA